MKKVFLLFAVSIFNFACTPNADVNSHSTMNHDGMNHNTTSDTDEPMNHGMDHSRMKSAPDAASAPYDLQFIDTMIFHHQSAIDMANLAATNTNNPELKKFAPKVVADQTREINQMKDWREKWYAGQPSALNMEMPGMADSMKMNMSELSAAKDLNFDLFFAQLMILHHEGAIKMSKEALTKAQRREIKTLANQIIKAQEAEIEMMKNRMAKWGEN